MDILAGIEEFVEDCWKNVFVEVHDAAVYIDHPVAECLHWYTSGKGYLALKDAGAIAVHELGMYHFRYAQVKNTTKAVILSTSGDPAFYQRTIKMILAKNTFEHCTIVCGTPPYPTDNSRTFPIKGKLDYIKLGEDVKVWMTSRSLSQDPTVNVIHIPLFIAHLTEDLFVTPPFGHLMPAVGADVSPDMVAELNHLASSLQELFERLNARLDIYSMGKFSERLADSLQNFNSKLDHRNHSPKTSEEVGVSLILIDRTLDLCTPTSNSSESFLAKILRTLPHLSHHDNDVAINMTPILGPIEGAIGTHRLPGCLAAVDKRTLDLLISMKQKKLLAIANQSLNDMLTRKDSPKPRTPLRISGHSLEKLLGKIRAADTFSSAISSREKLQMILSVMEASTSEKAVQLELLTSLEKLSLQNLSASRESSSILAQLSNVIQTRRIRGLGIENLLALVIHVYALAGTQIRFSPQQEHQLEQSIADAIFQDIKSFRENPSTDIDSCYQRTLLLLGMNDDALRRDISSRGATRIIDVFRAIAEQRSALQDYKHLLIKPKKQESIRHVGILEQLITDLFDADTNRELRDLRQRSASLISAGFNLFLRGRAKHHPCDNSWIVIYVVGGITAEEAKIIRESSFRCNEQKQNLRLTLAGSRLLNPSDIVDEILLSSINP